MFHVTWESRFKYQILQTGSRKYNLLQHETIFDSSYIIHILHEILQPCFKSVHLTDCINSVDFNSAIDETYSKNFRQQIRTSIYHSMDPGIRTKSETDKVKETHRTFEMSQPCSLSAWKLSAQSKYGKNHFCKTSSVSQ